MQRPLGPYGFRVVQAMTGGTPGRFAGVEYVIPVAYNVALMAGDAVKRNGTGRQIERAAAGDTVIGTFVGCQYYEPDGEVIYRSYWPASQPTKTNSVITAFVMDDPDTMLEVQMSGALTEAQIGQLANLIQVDAGDMATGRSGQAINSASIGTGDQYKILGLSPKYMGNLTYGSQNDVLVQAAKHELHTRAAI